jgi:Leucine-rich repeat (LRR) protein
MNLFRLALLTLIVLCGCQKPADVIGVARPAPAETAPTASTNRPPQLPESASQGSPVPPADAAQPQPAMPRNADATPTPSAAPAIEPTPPTGSQVGSKSAAVAALEKLGAMLDYGAGDRLIEVDFDGKPVTDADLELLAGLTDLKILNLSGTRITDEGLSRLAPLAKLKFLYLFRTEVTDAGLARLKELPRLEVLCLDQTLITDAGIPALETLPRLEKLHVHSRAMLTDASVDSLSRHVRLFELKIGGPGFSEQGIARLREALPRCKVVHDPNRDASDD